ncbi:hypothetical protein GCM10017620_12760 [Brevundimonas intermedia]|uniref:Uncharacterized protein n=1 Tax=Brevundimonas intermedia TaxID=74315 RepID=A0ABQ5T7D0_9CAUL|nr:hypothetical protein GCM10017620_12760 [Brevundimonas intermedia]
MLIQYFRPVFTTDRLIEDLTEKVRLGFKMPVDQGMVDVRFHRDLAQAGSETALDKQFAPSAKYSVARDRLTASMPDGASSLFWGFGAIPFDGAGDVWACHEMLTARTTSPAQITAALRRACDTAPPDWFRG